MGQKVNPIGLRLGINRTWDSRWYAEGKNYQQMLKEDLEIRKYIVENLPQAAISATLCLVTARLVTQAMEYLTRPLASTISKAIQLTAIASLPSRSGTALSQR